MDFSDYALVELYEFETYGKGLVSPRNGFALGKKQMDVTVAMWKEDLYRIIFPFELYADDSFPHWWLDKMFGIKIINYMRDYNEMSKA